MPVRPGVIPNMGDVSMATRIQIGLLGTKPKPRRRKKKAATRRAKATRRTRSSGSPRRRSGKKKPARLVKGSAAAKRHMAKLRRMRGKR